MAKLEASLAQMCSSSVRRWFDTKPVLMKELGGPIMDKTDISVAAERIGQLSKLEKLFAKNFSPFSDP